MSGGNGRANRRGRWTVRGGGCRPGAGAATALDRWRRRAGLERRPAVFVRYCRVGVLNDIGELLDPAVVVLLIGERPGLATAESLSAYLAYRPRRGHTDAQR